MAHTKAQRAVKGNRDSRSKRLGVKIYGGQMVVAGNIIIRQKGSRVQAGVGTLLAKDFTIQATRPGKVQFLMKNGQQVVAVMP